MGKIILTYNDVYEINQRLDKKALGFKLHLHDTCSSQSFTIEPLRGSAGDGGYEEMKNVITGYFEEKAIKINFLENNLEFYIVS
ncbi:MAG TPA: hypothetical protein GXX75_02805 [Clostridiales bacterium]|nr:hypothetical protein [Clostridiales bacterium]